MNEESKIADTFNEFFSIVVKELKIEKDDDLRIDTIEETNPKLKGIKTYKIYPSILRIKGYFKDPKIFSFKYFNVECVKREINNINSKNATPPTELKNANICPVYETTMINQIMDQLVFCHFYQNFLNVFYMSK